MKLEYPHFEYFTPASLREAIDLLTRYGAEAKVIAGGTDFLPAMRERRVHAAYLVDITRIRGLKGVEHANGDGLVIGALTTLQEILATPSITDHRAYGALTEAISRMGSRQIRNVGTIGGNICNASPAGDTLPALLVLDARINAVGPDGERMIALRDFFRSPGVTTLRHNEIVTSVLLPEIDDGTVVAYVRFSPRSALDLAVASAAVAFCMDAAGTCVDCKIALGAVAPTPIRATEGEQLLIGQHIDDDALVAMGGYAAKKTSPIADVRGSAEYRRAILPVLVERAARQALAKSSV